MKLKSICSGPWRRALPAAGILSAGYAPLAGGAVVVSDTFPYADGRLVGKTPAVGETWRINGGGQPLNVSGQQAQLTSVLAGRPTPPYEGAIVNFGSGFQFSSGKLYTRFDLTVPTVSGTMTDNNFSTLFRTYDRGGGNVAEEPAANGYLYAAAPTTGTGFRVAVKGNSNGGTAAAGTAFSGNLQFNTSYTVITAFDYATGNIALYINPTTESDVVATFAGTTQTGIYAFAFRQNGSDAPQSLLLDNLRIGTTFGEVAVVPEPALTAVAAGGGLGLLRRRRRA